jgi:hypothetical protein
MARRRALLREKTAVGRQHVGHDERRGVRGVRDSLKDGKFELTPPRFKQIEVNGALLPIDSPCPVVQR